MTTANVLFVCIRNAGRSKMAAAWPVARVREIRDDVKARVAKLLEEESWR